MTSSILEEDTTERNEREQLTLKMAVTGRETSFEWHDFRAAAIAGDDHSNSKVDCVSCSANSHTFIRPACG